MVAIFAIGAVCAAAEGDPLSVTSPDAWEFLLFTWATSTLSGIVIGAHQYWVSLKRQATEPDEDEPDD